MLLDINIFAYYIPWGYPREHWQEQNNLAIVPYIANKTIDYTTKNKNKRKKKEIYILK